MKAVCRFGGVLSLAALITAAAPGPARADAPPADVISAAQDLASRLASSPPVDTWVDESTKETAYQADVNRMAYLASLLAAELSSGKGRAETASIYGDLQNAGLRILARSRATGQGLPPGDVEVYERLMAKLQAFYGLVRPSPAK